MSEKEYIERDRLIHHLEYCIDDIRNTNGFTEDFEICLRAVQNQPTADVQEVRHGKLCHIGGDEWCCSCCGCIVTTEGSWERPTKKYCSECGAKMDKE